MSAGQRIRKLGFRKWYERELLQSHANLLLLLFSTLGLLGSAEALSGPMTAIDRLQVLAGAVACVGIGYLALRRYLRLLNHAEYVADQAICRSCNSYAKWELLGEDGDGAALQVRCRKCAHHWRITL